MLSVQARRPSPNPQNFPPNISTNRPVHQRASLLARPADWTYKHQAWGWGWIKAEEWGDRPGRNSLTGRVDPEKFRNHGCANQFLVVFGITWVQHGSAPRMVTLSWAEGSQLIRLGAASNEPIVLRILRTGCYLEPPGSYRCLTSWNVYWENHASKTWQTADTTMITKCETRPAAGMRLTHFWNGYFDPCRSGSKLGTPNLDD